MQEDRRKQQQMARLARTVEPAALEQALLRPEDQDIVRTDIPEREQLLNLPKLQEMDLRACARCVALPQPLANQRCLQGSLILLCIQILAP